MEKYSILEFNNGEFSIFDRYCTGMGFSYSQGAFDMLVKCKPDGRYQLLDEKNNIVIMRYPADSIWEKKNGR